MGIVLVSLFYQNNLLLLGLLIAAWLIGYKLLYKKEDLYFGIVGAIIGPFGEIIAIYFGVWQYSNPTFLGIPIWLPVLWFLAIMFIKRITETIKHMLKIR